jgi:hypothetical protein
MKNALHGKKERKKNNHNHDSGSNPSLDHQFNKGLNLNSYQLHNNDPGSNPSAHRALIMYMVG